MADVSSNNGSIDIPAYSRAGHAVIGIKASQGQNYQNPYHHNQSRDSHDFGLTVVHYHYCDDTDIQGQIENFRRAYLPVWRAGDYAAFDIELPNLDLSFANSILRKFALQTGHQPILYTYLDDLDSKLHGVVIPGKRLWLADYTLNKPNIDRKQYTFWAWQFTDGNDGPFPHIATGIGKCDISILSFGPALALNVRKTTTKRRK